MTDVLLFSWFWRAEKMQLWFSFLFLFHMNEGCTLNGNGGTERITAYTGGSVLLPCSCTDLNFKAERFEWKKQYTNGGWKVIPGSSEAERKKFQFFNVSAAGNLSLLITDLTEDDEGLYLCHYDQQYKYFQLSVKGCSLQQNYHKDISGNIGGSVVLLCSCTELQTTQPNFKWFYSKKTETNFKEIYPDDQTNRYQERVQMVYSYIPENLSLQISQLTKEDEGWYRCEIKDDFWDVDLTMNEQNPMSPSNPTPVSKKKIPADASQNTNTGTVTETDSNQKTPQTEVIVTSALGVLLLLLVFGGVMYWKYKAKTRQTVSDGSQQGRNCRSTDPLHSTTASTAPAYVELNPQELGPVYATIDSQKKHSITLPQNEVTYASVNHHKNTNPAQTLLQNEETTEYASIKTN